MINGKFSGLYVDDDGYISIDHTINRNISLTWHISGYGWQVYLGEVFVEEFDDIFTYPTGRMIEDVENIFQNIRATDFGNWEVSWISNKEYCRKHNQFDEFDDALTFYRQLEAEGEL